MKEEEENEFPSLVESIVASSLLLLSSTDCSGKRVKMSNSKSSSYLAVLGDGSKKYKNPKWSSCLSILDNENSVGLSNSKSSSSLSSLTMDDGSSAETCARQLEMVAVVSRNHEIKFKYDRNASWVSQVARRTRTPIVETSNHHKSIICVNKTSSELSTTTTEASSCISSGSSRSGSMVVSSGLKLNRPVNSGSIRRRAEGIMRVLSYGCASEVRIRQLLGDSPDTSKALRMLLKKEQVGRSGNGGRCDPFIYKIA